MSIRFTDSPESNGFHGGIVSIKGHSTYFPFNKSEEEQRKAAQDFHDKEFLRVYGDQNSAYKHASQRTWGEFTIPTGIRGLGLSVLTPVRYLKSGAVTIRPYVRIEISVNNKTKSFSSISITKLINNYQTYVDMIVELRGLPRAKKGWRTIPFTREQIEELYERGIAKKQKELKVSQ